MEEFYLLPLKNESAFRIGGQVKAAFVQSCREKTMRFVIDSDRLFAALTKQGTCREILFSSQFAFFRPLEITGEVAKYREELISKAKIDPSQFAQILAVLMSRVQQTSLDDVSEAEQTASTLMEAVDPKDSAVLFKLV